VRPLLATIRDRWARDSASPPEGASANSIRAFEERYGVTVPEDFREYLRELNGRSAGRDDMDSTSISFWRLDEFEPSEHMAAGSRLFAFADFLIDSHRYAIALDDIPSVHGAVFLDMSSAVIRIANSFTQFLELYATNDEQALAGGKPVEPAA
jgi:hypothetical protein